MRTRTHRSRLAAGLLVVGVLASVVHPAQAAPGSTARVSVTSSEKQANNASPAAMVGDTTSPQLSLDGLTVAFSSDATNLVAGDTNGVADVFVRDLVKGRTYRVSLSSSGQQANGPSHSPALSVDGRYVAFVSEATNLVPGDTNRAADVFVRDRVAGTTRRVSVSATGAQANGASARPFVSLFGDFIAYESAASNLVRGDTNGLSDAFLYNVKTKKVRRLMPPPDALPPATTPAGIDVPDPATVLRRTWTAKPSISYDGRFVTFVRGTYNRQPAVPSSLDIFILERRTGTYRRVGISPWNGFARVLADNPVVSADGRIVAFEAWSVLDNVPNTAQLGEAAVRNPLDPKDVFAYDIASGTLMQISINTWAIGGNGDSYAPTISAGGQYLAFVSEATNLVAGDANGAPDVFVRDIVTRQTSRMSLTATNAEAAAGGARPSISYEGRRIAFASGAPLVAGDGNGVSDVFLRDRRTDTANAPPRLRSLAGRTIDNMEETSIRLRATDPDGDPVRYGFITVKGPSSADHPAAELIAGDRLPAGSTLHPVTGVFRWRPTPEQAGSWTIIFWADDPRGAGDYRVWNVVVRTPEQTAGCAISPC